MKLTSKNIRLYFKRVCIISCLASMVASCAFVKPYENINHYVPFLGSIGKEHKPLLKKEFISVGTVILEKPIAVTATTIPFTKATLKLFNSVTNVKNLTGGKAPKDSVAQSLGSYTQIQILDRVGFKEALNSDKNKKVLAYLKKDPRCKLVSTVWLKLDEATTKNITAADGLFIVADKDGILQIEKVYKGKRSILNISKKEVFNYTLMGFCWEKNRRGAAVIASLTEGNRCPKSTNNSAFK